MPRNQPPKLQAQVSEEQYEMVKEAARQSDQDDSMSALIRRSVFAACVEIAHRVEEGEDE